MDKRVLIVLGAILVQGTVVGCVFGYGVFFTVLETEFGWSRTLLSLATSIAFFNMGFLAIGAGRLTDRFGPAGVLTVAAFATGTAYGLMYFLSAPWQLLLIYGLLVSIGLAAHDVVTLSTVAKWFPHHRGRVSGIVKVGTACGQMAVPPLVVVMISSVGWRSAYVAMGIGACVLLLLAAGLMSLKPASGASNAGVKDDSGISMQQAVKSTEFWMLCAIQFFFFGTMLAIPTHIVPHAIDSGLSATKAAFVLSTIAASSVAGRLLVGNFIDSIGGRRGYNICLLFLLVSLLMLLFIEQPGWLFLFSLVYGFAHGGLFTLVSPTVAEYFGMRSHGMIFGVIVCTGTVGGAALPILTGYIYDRQQSYFWAFVMLLSMVFTSFVVSMFLSAPKQSQLDSTSPHMA